MMVAHGHVAVAVAVHAHVNVNVIAHVIDKNQPIGDALIDRHWL